MYLCIDVGGTKTLIACLDENGVIIEKIKIPTSRVYKTFLKDIQGVLQDFNNNQFVAGAIGVPAALIDRDKRIAHKFSNLPWINVSIAEDIEAITNCKIFMENDSKLGGLSEAMLIKENYSKVMYISISTGIGYSFIDNLRIDTNTGDGGGRMLLVEKDGTYVPWENLASGQAIVKLYGKMAKDIISTDTWMKISTDITKGISILVSIFQPQIIIFGGSVGNFFDKYGDLVRNNLIDYHIPYITLPKLKGAERSDDAVIYGCYDYIKQRINGE
jgi:glucokinase